MQPPSQLLALLQLWLPCPLVTPLGIQVVQSHQQSMARCKLRVLKWKMKAFFCVSFAKHTWTTEMVKHLRHSLVDILSTLVAWESGVEWPRSTIFTSAHCIRSPRLNLPNKVWLEMMTLSLLMQKSRIMVQFLLSHIRPLLWALSFCESCGRAFADLI